MDQMLLGRVAVVTGAADGMGRGIVDLFSDHGAMVLATDIAGDKLEAVHAKNPNVRTLAIDITQIGAADAIIGAAIATFGELHILANVAGIFRLAMFEDLTQAEWHQMMDVNVNAPFSLCKRAIPELKKISGGRIINIASTSALRARKGMGAYTVSKHAMAGLTISLAVELGEFGITANYINPGTIVTGITRDLVQNPVWKRDLESQGVLNRMGTVAEIAHAALYLAGPNSGFTTGHGLAVDGGFLIKYPDRIV
jgi:NAD(P)-dependent dehydrogenase (short-subunit alcohol dehydrogenase family)